MSIYRKTLVSKEEPTMLIIVNPYFADDSDLDSIWNTGLAAAGEAHFGEEVIGRATLPMKELVSRPDILDHTYELRLFRTNEFIQLQPGDVLVLECSCSQALNYYLNLADSDIFKIGNRGAFEEKIVIAGGAVPYTKGSTVTWTLGTIQFGEEFSFEYDTILSCKGNVPWVKTVVAENGEVTLELLEDRTAGETFDAIVYGVGTITETGKTIGYETTVTITVNTIT